MKILLRLLRLLRQRLRETPQSLFPRGLKDSRITKGGVQNKPECGKQTELKAKGTVEKGARFERWSEKREGVEAEKEVGKKNTDTAGGTKWTDKWFKMTVASTLVKRQNTKVSTKILKPINV